MEKLLNFLNYYLVIENEFLKAKCTEPDRSKVLSLYEQLASHFICGARPNPELTIPNIPDDKRLKQGESTLTSSAKRLLFQIKEYEHPVEGRIYRAYLSNFFKYNISKYFFSDFLKERNGAYKFFSLYSLKRDLLDAEDTEDITLKTDLSQYRYSGGRELKELGKLLTIKKITAPSPAWQLAEYNTE